MCPLNQFLRVNGIRRVHASLTKRTCLELDIDPEDRLKNTYSRDLGKNICCVALNKLLY